MKICSKCDKELELTLFYHNCKAKDGLTAKCITCIKEATKKRYEETPTFMHRVKYHDRKESVIHNYKAFIKRNPKYNEQYQKIWRQLQSELLTDSYVRHIIGDLPIYPQSLIETQRLIIKINRKINEIKGIL